MSDTLVGVIIGAVIGIIGSLVVETFRSIRQKKREAQKLRVEHIKEKKAEYRFLMETIIKLERSLLDSTSTINEAINNKITINEIRSKLEYGLLDILPNIITQAYFLNYEPLIEEINKLRGALRKDFVEIKKLTGATCKGLDKVKIEWNKITPIIAKSISLILDGYKKLDDEILKLSQ